MKQLLLDDLFRKFEQVVVYGAKGWLGRSTVDLLVGDKDVTGKDQLLLLGSKSQAAMEANLPLDMFSSTDGLKLISKNSLFINSAFLRREKLSEMSDGDFYLKNEEISSFPKSLLEKRSVSAFVNLSSGAARNFDVRQVSTTHDPYGFLKFRFEEVFRNLAQTQSIPLINCRIFSISGSHINEFQNLALSSFISQAKSDRKVIKIESPRTLRTYVDSGDLMSVLLNLALLGKTMDLDSGGSLVELGQVAELISKKFDGATLELKEKNNPSGDYYGNFQEFNSLSSSLNIELKSMEEQIDQTLLAFH